MKIAMNKISQTIWEIRPSLMLPGEIGLFAAKPLHVGMILLGGNSFDETWVSWEDMDFVDNPAVGRAMIEKWCYFDDDGAWLPTYFNRIQIYYHINHSCQPNVGHNKNDDWISLRDIAAGEELYMDFRLTGLASWFTMECRCGTPECAGVIRGDAWKDRSFAKANLDRFPPYFRAKVAAYHGFK
jgi:hypothetical protein